MFTPGDKVGAHRIVARMATGGMATVFLAQREGQEGPSSYVVIKAIHRQLSSDTSFRAMFLDEARLTQRIRHANVVTAHELGEHHGVLYLVMDLVHGVSLRQLLEALAMDSRRLVPEVAVYLIVRAAEGLHAAHSLTGEDGQSLNVVHRDVTPDNLLVGFDGIVRIIDFGVAKARDRIAPTSMGVVKGKFGYMAPEQARGTAVDARTDVFALAIVLWETLVAKRAAVVTSDAEAFAWARNPSFAPVSSIMPGLAPELDAVLARALSVDPEGRPKSMLEFASELLAACPGAAQGTTGHVATLLSTVITTRIEETRLAMPPDVADVLNGSRFQENPNSLAQLTVKLPEGYVSDFAASAIGPTEVARASMVAAQPAKAAVAIAPAVRVQGQTPVGYKPPAPSSLAGKGVPKPVARPGAAAPVPARAGVPAAATPAAAAPIAAAPVAAAPVAAAPVAAVPVAAVPVAPAPVQAEPPTVTTPGATPSYSAEPPTVTSPATETAVAPAPPVDVLVPPPPAPQEGMVPSSPPPAMSAEAAPAPAYVAPVQGIAPPPQALLSQPPFGSAPVAQPDAASPLHAHPQPGQMQAAYAQPEAQAAQTANPQYWDAAGAPAPAPAAVTASEAPPKASGGAGRKIFGALIALSVLGAIVFGGYYAYGRYVTAQAIAAAGTPPTVPVVTAPPVTPPVVPTPVPPAAVLPDASVAVAADAASADAAVVADATADAARDAAPEAAVAAPVATTTPVEPPPPPPSMQTTTTATPPPAMTATTTTAMTSTTTAMTTTAMTTTAMTTTAMTTAMTTTTMTTIMRPDF